VSAFDEIYERSLREPEAFWTDAAAEIDWIEPWERVLDDSDAPFYRWFAGPRLNSCYDPAICRTFLTFRAAITRP
jgi:propionyl-CoA synthetase